MASVSITHEIQVAHRLLNLPGKCQNIHGHSMRVVLTLFALVDQDGIIGGLDFHTLKRHFREYLDHFYDHHLLLNEKDPWAQPLGLEMHVAEASSGRWTGPIERLPGLITMKGDPTTENIARSIWKWAKDVWGKYQIEVTVHETATNSIMIEKNGQ
jgi:6-pyruvoyl-tetrahydropterin synthase